MTRLSSKKHLRSLLVLAVAPLIAFGQSRQVEPTAGTWKTWIISSGRDFRVPPPPDAAATASELAWLREAVAQQDPRALDQISFWDAGSPAYRWMDLMMNRFLLSQPLSAYPHRAFAYVSVAMHDATIAAWESKYFYNRRRPAEVDPTLRTRVATPNSPSYPSEHAAAAGAAAAVLSYLLPDEAAYFQALAEEAGRSRLFAGVQFPSDNTAGLELGRMVAARVIDRARVDGSAEVWTGTVPTGSCMWTGTNPGNVTMPNWKPFLLSRPDEFRPPPPLDCQSAEVKAEVDAVRQYTRTFTTNYKAFYWQSPDGLLVLPYTNISKWLFEDKMDNNPPRASRAYALLSAANFDAFIASNDGKFTYWYLRPHQLDSGITPLFPVPNFPSYPSNHSTLSTAKAEVLAYLFPRYADLSRAIGKEAGDSRIWAGIHYQMDNQSGVELGKKVASKFIAWAGNDGSK